MKKQVSWMIALWILSVAAIPAMAATDQAQHAGNQQTTQTHGGTPAMGPNQGDKLLRAVQSGNHKALSTLLQAAHGGDAVAQSTLGTLYERGQGVRQDYAKAARWYRKAAQQGWSPAQVSLGMLYSDGRGVGRDYHQAEQWLLKAADQGNANGMTSLGILYELGLGVPRNHVIAYALYSLAVASGGHKDAVFYRRRLHAYINNAGRAKAKALMQQMQKAKRISSVLKGKT